LNQFIAHGESQLSVEGQILIIDITGPCNIEFFHELHHDLVRISKKINVENYATLLILRGEAIFVEEVFEYHVEFLKKVKTKAIAIDLEYCETPSVTKAMCHKAYCSAEITHEFFENMSQAKNWLTHDILTR